MVESKITTDSTFDSLGNATQTNSSKSSGHKRKNRVCSTQKSLKSSWCRCLKIYRLKLKSLLYILGIILLTRGSFWQYNKNNTVFNRRKSRTQRFKLQRPDSTPLVLKRRPFRRSKILVGQQMQRQSINQTREHLDPHCFARWPPRNCRTFNRIWCKC